MRANGTIDYVELPGTNLEAVKSFYGSTFGWTFTDYGPSYAAFTAGVDGGFDADHEPGAKPLVVLFTDDLEATLTKVRAGGAEIVKDPYAFPGGRRFLFRDPAGNVLAVWSEK